MTRVLVTGAGSAAALVLVDSLRGDAVTLFLGAVDPHEPALRLVQEGRRITTPTCGDTASLVRACAEHHIDVLVPTRDVDLLGLARQRHRFGMVGTTVMLPATASLEASLDRWALHRVCDGVVDRPRTAVFGASLDLEGWRFPLVVKPRFRGDPRPVHIVRSLAEAKALRRDPTLLVQAYLPGEEIEVDVLAGPLGSVVASVPHTVEGRAIHVRHREAPIAAAGRVVRALRMAYASTVRMRQDADGRLVVVDVVPRIGAGMVVSNDAGVNLPWLSLQLALGRTLPPDAHVFREMSLHDTRSRLGVPAAS